MSTVQVLSAIACFFGFLISAFNWMTIFPRRNDRDISPAPLLGGVLLAIGFRGFETTRPYWWLAALIDFGTLGVLFALPMILGEAWAHRDRNALHLFDSTADDRSVKFQLFKNGDCVIDISFDPPRRFGPDGQQAVSAGFIGRWHSYDDGFEVSEYAGGRILHLTPNRGSEFTVAERYPDGDEPLIYALNGITVDATRLNTDR